MWVFLLHALMHHYITVFCKFYTLDLYRSPLNRLTAADCARLVKGSGSGKATFSEVWPLRISPWIVSDEDFLKSQYLSEMWSYRYWAVQEDCQVTVEDATASAIVQRFVVGTFIRGRHAFHLFTQKLRQINNLWTSMSFLSALRYEEVNEPLPICRQRMSKTCNVKNRLELPARAKRDVRSDVWSVWYRGHHMPPMINARVVDSQANVSVPDVGLRTRGYI